MSCNLLDDQRSGIASQFRPAESYALGYTESELRRLALQSTLFGDVTADLFSRAGLARGMRVLDLGCGAGDVSFLAADFVGLSGSVIGVDRSEETITWAARRARGAERSNVAFAAADLDDYEPPTPFDAIVGRFVLMYLPDPAATLRRLVRWLRPGGRIAVLEFDTTVRGRSIPEMPLVDICVQRIWAALRSAGADAEMGLKLPRVFRQAGLPPPHLSLSAHVAADSDSLAYENLAEGVRSLLPRMEEFGIASAREVEIETLAERLHAEAFQHEGVMIYPATIGAWTRVR
jgi:ubiquinone/menaquinone biosynthesis C-methylase UbiE